MRGALDFLRRAVEQRPSEAGWWLWFVVLEQGGARELVGHGGFKGPPRRDGSIEIGYALVAEQRGRGIATEAMRALLDLALEDARVLRILARTLPSLPASVRVMEKLGLRPAGEGEENGERTLVYALERPPGA